MRQYVAYAKLITSTNRTVSDTGGGWSRGSGPPFHLSKKIEVEGKREGKEKKEKAKRKRKEK